MTRPPGASACDGHLQQVPALVVGEVVQEAEQQHRVGGRDVGQVLLAEDLAW